MAMAQIEAAERLDEQVRYRTREFTRSSVQLTYSWPWPLTRNSTVRAL